MEVQIQYLQLQLRINNYFIVP